MKQKKLKCDACPFILTASAKGNESIAGDVCPWCNKGILKDWVKQKDK